ncbi:MAG: hypothetical protein HYR51_09160 [Candidatus Rokubacteria bacterium]|nr:hypothetical protein [Candidatus Rokubacteria bacterium]
MLVTASVVHAGGWTPRPLGDFLGAQGSTSDFVPPVPDYVGWVDGEFVTFALVDYPGLAAGWIEDATGGAESLGTKVRGTVMERAAPDGRAEVRVRLVTSRALSWAFLIADVVDFSDPLFFLTTPLAFGARAQDVVDGATPSLGKAHFDVTFTNSAPGAPLPDLVQLLNAPLPGQLPVTFRFRSLTCGTTPDGTPARLTIDQVCSDTGSGQVCAAAVVEIAPLASACDDD